MTPEELVLIANEYFVEKIFDEEWGRNPKMLCPRTQIGFKQIRESIGIGDILEIEY